mmetsp:Transcript_24515/g.53343  ORF Transcript_24515/g.53343 Transcript_24515/m.53343 type:complete len:392 (-) Transcript_24515:527-1702(-)
MMHEPRRRSIYLKIGESGEERNEEDGDDSKDLPRLHRRWSTQSGSSSLRRWRQQQNSARMGSSYLFLGAISAIGSTVAADMASGLAVDRADVLDAVARVVAGEVHVVAGEAASRHLRARVGLLAVPLIKSEPLVLALHRVVVVVTLLATEAPVVLEDPQVHHDLGRLVRDRDSVAGLPADLSSIDVPSDAVGQPLEGVGVEVGTSIRSVDVPGILDVGAPSVGVVSRKNVGRHGIRAVAGDLEIDLSPVLVLGVPENEERGDVVSINNGVSRLHLRCLPLGFIPAIAEHVVLRSHLATAQCLGRDLSNLRLRARLLLGRRAGSTDLHLATFKHNVLLREAHLALCEAAIRPGPDEVVVEVDGALELLHELQSEAIVRRILLVRVGVAIDLA